MKVIARIKGGLGNQLFCYAAARGVALRNNAELVIDDVSGFKRDLKYKRNYCLDRFNIAGRKATRMERLEPFERYRRAYAKWLSSFQSYERRNYLEQESRDFDTKLISIRLSKDLYLDGLWQSENYFKDIEDVIRKDFQIKQPSDSMNTEMAARISIHRCAVALHVRWFDQLSVFKSKNNVSVDYYHKAVAYAQAKLVRPHFFLFSDEPEFATTKLSLPDRDFTVVSHNSGDESAYADMWLMSLCQHFITANSTFSWWGAWLSNDRNKLVITPDPESLDSGSAWRADKLVPENWIRI